MRRRSFITIGIVVLLALTVMPVAVPSVTVKGRMSMKAVGPVPDAIIGNNDTKMVQDFAPGGATPNPTIFANRKPVGAVAPVGTVPYRGNYMGANGSFCSGFLIGDDRFLTNGHCINSQTGTVCTGNNAPPGCSCDSAVVWFNYEKVGGVNQTVEIRKCVTLASFSPPLVPDGSQADLSHLDYALLVLDGHPGNRTANGYGFLTVSNRDPVNSEDLTIIQHPGGKPKMVDSYFSTSDSCKVGQAFSGGNSGSSPTAELSHTCDTEGGSSGSPVIARNGNVVIGLHHATNSVNANFAIRIGLILFVASDGPTSTVVGGTIQPFNSFAILAPFIALAGALVSTITALAATYPRRLKHSKEKL